jgi:hypothetical protein
VVEQPPPSQPPRTTWWSRNWKWAVPVLCVLGVLVALLPVLLVGAGAYFVFSLVDHTFKSSGGYQQALVLARSDPAVTAALGTPIKDGWFPTGNVDSSGTRGTSDLAIPVSGPRGKGTLYLRAVSDMGEWRFTQLVLKVHGTGETIDLLAGRVP